MLTNILNDHILSDMEPLARKELTVDELAAMTGRHVLKVNELMRDLGVHVDTETGVIDADTFWNALAGVARRAVLERQAEARAKAKASRAAASPAKPEERKPSAVTPILAKLAETSPELFPRTRVASPEDREQALLADFQDQLAEVAELVDENATPEFFRRWIEALFKEPGFVVKREGRSGATFILTHAEVPGVTLKVATYISMTRNRFGQVSFVVRRLNDESLKWVVLFARPERRIFLLRKADILERFAGREDDSIPDNASFTIRKGTPSTWLFDHRISELVREFKEKTDNHDRSDTP